MFVHGSLASPFVQRVAMAARAKGHELDVRPPVGGSMRSPEFRAISPMGRIPLLELDDGTHICESAAIAGYLDETLSGPALMPGDVCARARVREIESLAVGEVAAALRPLMVHLVFAMGDAPQIVDAARGQLRQGLDALDRVVATDGHACGETLTLADCALVPILTLCAITDARTGALSEVAERTNVAAYRERVADDPVAARTAQEMEKGFADILARNRATG